METFSALLALCAGNSPVRWIPPQRPETRSFDVFFDMRPKKRLSKQLWEWWFETPSWSLWRQCNGSYWIWYMMSSVWNWYVYLHLHLVYNVSQTVNLNLRGPTYPGLTWSVSWSLRFGSMRRQHINARDIYCVKWVGPCLLLCLLNCRTFFMICSHIKTTTLLILITVSEW